MKWFMGNALSVCLHAAAVCCLSAFSAVANPLEAKIDTFFTGLSTEFDRIAADPAVRKGSVGPIDKLFLRELKRHQVIHAFARTSAKGRNLTELARMKQPDHSKNSLKAEPWYAEIAKGAPEFSAMDRDTGRYYLVWSKPVAAGSKKASAFGGVVMMKIDLWDCFQKISQSVETPFLVRLNKKTLYSHKWKNDEYGIEAPLSIKGVPKITLQVSEGAAPAKTVQPQAQPAAPAIDSAKLRADSMAAAKKKASAARAKKIGVAGAIAAGLILLILIISFISWIRNKMLIRSINRGI